MSRTTSTNPGPNTASRDSATMLAAIAILAYAASLMTHEALGHGGYCLAAGGRNLLLTPWKESCDFPGAAQLAIKAAGPGAQFAAGLLAWAALHLSVPKAPRLHYFLWLYMVFNLLISSSYIAWSGVTGFGDAAELIAGHAPRILWRTGLVLLGAAPYVLSLQAAAWELKRFAGSDISSKRLLRLVSIPYVSVGIFACCIGTLSQTMGHDDAAIAMAAASSLGSGAGLFRLPSAQRKMTGSTPSTAAYIHWSYAWGLAAAGVVLVFLLFVGPGLR